jgi:hypothetical protein
MIRSTESSTSIYDSVCGESKKEVEYSCRKRSRLGLGTGWMRKMPMIGIEDRFAPDDGGPPELTAYCTPDGQKTNQRRFW